MKIVMIKLTNGTIETIDPALSCKLVVDNGYHVYERDFNEIDSWKIEEIEEPKSEY